MLILPPLSSNYFHFDGGLYIAGDQSLFLITTYGEITNGGVAYLKSPRNVIKSSENSNPRTKYITCLLKRLTFYCNHPLLNKLMSHYSSKSRVLLIRF